MVSKKPPSQDSADNPSGIWPVGEIPDWVLLRLGEQIVYRLAIGSTDFTGDDVEAILAQAFGGTHRKTRSGIVDVFTDEVAWSVKTVKKDKPWEVKKVRLISGRNAPDKLENDPKSRNSPEVAGKEVLKVWNARVEEALIEYGEVRSIYFIRNMEDKKFSLFEDSITKFSTGDYYWKFKKHKKSRNLHGYEKATDMHAFTWQPRGSQFTIIRPVPNCAQKFSINRAVPLAITPKSALRAINYNQAWITLKSSADDSDE